MDGKSTIDKRISNLEESSGAFPGSLPWPSGEGLGTTCLLPQQLCPSEFVLIICLSPLPPSDCDLLKTETEFSYLHTTDNCTVLEI